MITKHPLIGAHMSTAGGLENALYDGAKIGCTTVQIFTSNQRQWASRQLNDEILQKWFEALEETGMQQVMSHDSYLINLGAPDAEILAKSRKAFRAEIERCRALNITYLNFHPGAALKEDRQQCLDRIVESLLEMQELLPDDKTRLLLETTAGQGSVVGCLFEELGYIIKNLHGKIPIGVCIDTCHIFAAGYDCRTAASFDAVLKDFDKHIGLEFLYAFHLNDSMKGLGTRVDRHRPLGEGEIGLECFKFLMTDPRTRDKPKYLETPDGPPLWEKEIVLLNKFAKG